ncbi:unnamed protein product, partial [Didymodactylos carnosus]
LFECLDQCIAPSLSCGDGSCYLPSCSCNLIPNCKNMRDEDNCKSHEICKMMFVVMMISIVIQRKYSVLVSAPSVIMKSIVQIN